MGRIVPALVRRRDWVEQLARYLERCHGQPYHPVDHHCAVFVLGALEAMTGVTSTEVLAALNIPWLPDSEVAIARTLVERNGLRGLVTELFGEAPRLDRCARRGDVALIDGDTGEAIGIVEANGICALTPDGVWRFPLKDLRGYWHL